MTVTEKRTAEITDQEKTSIPFSHLKLQKYRCHRQTVPDLGQNCIWLPKPTV
jgi:hypothetical protein